MAQNLRACFRLVAHTLLSFFAALTSAGALYSFFRPILGKDRYHQFAQTPLMWSLLLTAVAIGGAQIYRRWPDRLAFFAWVFPATWVCYLALSRATAEMKGAWSDPLFLLGIAVSYSVGALIGSIIRNFGTRPAELQ